jgi:hypothetical protein
VHVRKQGNPSRSSRHKDKQDMSKAKPSTMPKSKRVSDEPAAAPKPTSLGEELYFVHLQRHAGEVPREDDFDHESPRKRGHSVGEELWEVHLRRSQGLPEDLEDDGTNHELKAKDRKKAQGQAPSSCRYNLRSKDQHDVKGQ